MRIFTWNVNSIIARQPLLERLLDAERPDVIGLQELKTTDDRVPMQVFESRGYHVLCHGQRQYNGVLLASRTPLLTTGVGLAVGDEDQARLCHATITTAAGDSFHVVNLYCPQGATADSEKFAYKLRFYDALLDWLGPLPKARMIVLGDLNIAPEPRDIWDPVAMAAVPSFHPLEHQRWRALCGLGLSDAVASRVAPGTYSFWDYRSLAFPRNEGMRIDHILVGDGVRGAVRGAGILRSFRKKIDGMSASDHAPVWIEIDPSALGVPTPA